MVIKHAADAHGGDLLPVLLGDLLLQARVQFRYLLVHVELRGLALHVLAGLIVGDEQAALAQVLYLVGYDAHQQAVGFHVGGVLHQERRRQARAVMLVIGPEHQQALLVIVVGLLLGPVALLQVGLGGPLAAESLADLLYGRERGGLYGVEELQRRMDG